MWTPKLIRRFCSKISIPDNLDDCWEWMAAVNGKGYGFFGVEGKQMRAHRISWELFVGEQIPEGMCVCHKCDNPRCVNPDHLFLGTPADNSADMLRKRRQANGEKNGMSKLNRAQVLEIRSREGQTQRDLAEEFRVSQSNIHRVLSGEGWIHV